MMKKIGTIYFIAVTLLLIATFTLNLFSVKNKITASLLNLQGNYSYQMSAYDDAEVYYKKALKEEPGVFYIQYNLGNAFYKQERYIEAIQTYKQALKSRKGSATILIWNNLGNSLYHEGMLLQSTEAYAQALLLNKNDVKIRHDYLFVANKLREDEEKKMTVKDDKKLAGNEKNKSDVKGKDDSKRKNDKDDKLAQTEISDSNIKDIFKLISQNEDDARNNVGKSKHKINKIETGTLDY